MLELVALFALLGTPECRMRMEYVPPTPDRGIVLARATGDTVRVPVRSASGYFRGTLQPDDAVAYRFEVLEVSGGPGGLDAGDSFLAVPWAYTQSCAWIPFAEQWVPAGEESLFYFREAGDFQGEVVTDVYGWHEPYPHGEFVKYAGVYERAPEDREEWMSPRELFRLLNALPPRTLVETDFEWGNRVRAALEGGPPEWTSRWPATEILQRLSPREGR